MERNKLIKLLQGFDDIDPEGKLNVCVGNVDIFDVDGLPAYYDGRLQVLQYNDKGRVTGGKYVSSGSKIVLNTMSISDALWSYGEGFEVDYSEVPAYQLEQIKENHAKILQQKQDIERESSLRHFKEHVWKRVSVQTDDITRSYSDGEAEHFFDLHLHSNDKIPRWARPITLIPSENGGSGHYQQDSHYNQLEKLWLRVVDVSVVGDDMYLKLLVPKSEWDACEPDPEFYWENCNPWKDEDQADD